MTSGGAETGTLDDLTTSLFALAEKVQQEIVTAEKIAEGGIAIAHSARGGGK